MRFLIIGGDAAGMSAASKVKRRMPEVEVVVLERGKDVSYSACGMPYNIAEPETGIEELVVRDADTFIHKQHIDLRLDHNAESIDARAKIVRGMGGDQKPFTLTYDKLLIATGAAPVMPDIPGLDHNGVFPLKSLDHGRRIKHFIATKNVHKAVIIGMGYVGLEMCEALRVRGIEVAMVKPGSRFLPWMNPELARVVNLEVTNNRVAMHPGQAIDSIVAHNGSMRVCCDTVDLDADMVIVASGVRPNSEIALEAGLATGIAGAISVDDQLRTSDPDIYSAGDCADSIHVVTGERCWIPLALRANRAGWAVADNVCGVETRLEGIVGTAVFKFFDLEIARTGLTPREAEAAGFDPVEVVVKNSSKAHAQKGSTTIYTAMTGDKKQGAFWEFRWWVNMG